MADNLNPSNFQPVPNNLVAVPTPSMALAPFVTSYLPSVYNPPAPTNVTNVYNFYCPNAHLCQLPFQPNFMSPPGSNNTYNFYLNYASNPPTNMGSGPYPVQYSYSNQYNPTNFQPGSFIAPQMPSQHAITYHDPTVYQNLVTANNIPFNNTLSNTNNVAPTNPQIPVTANNITPINPQTPVTASNVPSNLNNVPSNASNVISTKLDKMVTASVKKLFSSLKLSDNANVSEIKPDPVPKKKQQNRQRRRVRPRNPIPELPSGDESSDSDKSSVEEEEENFPETDYLNDFIVTPSKSSPSFNEIIQSLCEKKDEYVDQFEDVESSFSRCPVHGIPEEYRYLLDLNSLDEATLQLEQKLWELITSPAETTAQIADKVESIACIGWAQAIKEVQHPIVNHAVLSFSKLKKCAYAFGVPSYTAYFKVRPKKDDGNFIGCQVRQYSKVELKSLNGNNRLDGRQFTVTKIKSNCITLTKKIRGDLREETRASRIRFIPQILFDKIKRYKSFVDEDISILDCPHDFMYRNIVSSVNYVRTRDLEHITDPTPSFNLTVDEFNDSFNEILPALKKETDLNDRQAQALFSICTRSHNNSPFLLHGPPGTGKTRTIGQTTLFLLAMDSNNRILLMAPSNKAADMLALEMLKLVDGKLLTHNNILRLCSNSTDIVKRDKRLDPICSFSKKDKSFSIPEDGRNFRVVICTLGCSPHILKMMLPKNFFTHMFIDEAGQANHADYWLPVCSIATKNTSLILCGDPKQLGPVSEMHLSRDVNQMTESVLWRYMSMAMYKNDPRSRCLLNMSYRCHRHILLISSQIFYENQLLAADERRSEPFENWDALPKKGFPILFIDVKHGKELEREETKSFANLEEVDVITKITERLMNDFNLSPHEIGVIAPYKHQGGWVDSKLEQSNTPGINKISVDSVECYQGSERKIIVITATRTERMGFLANRQRLNTAITRAMNLLVVIGNKELLRKDRCWERFIEYCHKNDSLIRWTGEVQDF